MSRSRLRRLWSAIAPLVLLIACAPAPPADTDETLGTEPPAATAEVVGAVQALFDAMAARDTVALRRVLAPDARLMGVADSTAASNGMTGAAFIENIGRPGPVPLERFWEPEVRIEGPIATVWTRYDLHRDGVFSHCGTDAFQLARRTDGWMIESIVWTVQRENCPPSPLGSP